MLPIGKTDVFEAVYTEKFRNMFRGRGVFVQYEKDRGARDIGIHLTEPLPKGRGGARVTSAFCWFQLKGKMATTLSESEFQKANSVKISLEVNHLQFWYTQFAPTYLALYIESVDRFLILNLQQYVADRWGKSVFSVPSATVTIEVPTTSILDDQAIALILRTSNEREWQIALNQQSSHVKQCVRNWKLIWQIAAAEQRGSEVRAEIVDWQSKLRGELYFAARNVDMNPNPSRDNISWQKAHLQEPEWKQLRGHWQLGMRAEEIEALYPYLDFLPLASDPDDSEEDSWMDDDDGDDPILVLASGTRIRGTDAAGEYFYYQLRIRLNALGKQLHESICQLRDIGFIEVDADLGDFISVAPWHSRSV